MQAENRTAIGLRFMGYIFLAIGLIMGFKNMSEDFGLSVIFFVGCTSAALLMLALNQIIVILEKKVGSE